MDLFHQLHDESISTLQRTMSEQHERLIRNAEEVKADIQKSFGCYFGWLREREAVLMRGVDRAVEVHLSRWQSSVCEAMVSLKMLRESVELLDDADGGENSASKDVKDQIERLLRDMSSAMEDDLRSDHVVRFEESGRVMLRTAMDNCGEVSTQHKKSPSPLKSPQTITSSSKLLEDYGIPSRGKPSRILVNEHSTQFTNLAGSLGYFYIGTTFRNGKENLIEQKYWSNWLQSGTNLEHLEEPEIPYDFDDLGSIMSIAKMDKSDPSTAKKLPNRTSSLVQPPVFSSPLISVPTPVAVRVVEEKKEKADHFAYLMSTPMEQWLKPVAVAVLQAQPQVVSEQQQQVMQKAQVPLVTHVKRSVCASGGNNCTLASDNLEMENLDQLQCITPAPVAKDLQTWLMQPDVVPLPAVKQVCRGERQCSSLNECLGTNHCLNYFYSLSKCTEDWLSNSAKSTNSAAINTGLYKMDSFSNDKDNDSVPSKSTSTYKFSSSGEEFEVLPSCSPASSSSQSLSRDPSVVSEDLKVWLRSSGLGDYTSSACSQCSASDCCLKTTEVVSPVVSKGIHEWLLKTC